MPRDFDPSPSRTPSKGTVQMIKGEPLKPKDDPYTRGFNEAKEMAAKCAGHKAQSAQIAADTWAVMSPGQDIEFVKIKNAEAQIAREIWNAICALQVSPEKEGDWK